jgi:hypothetical protein
LGDAITAAAAVRAGGQPPSIGSFRATIEARERAFEAQQAAAEQQARDLRNRIRVGDWQARQKAKLEARAPTDKDTTEKSVFGSQQMFERGAIPEHAVGREVVMRYISNPETGQVESEEFLAMATPKQPTIKTFAGIVNEQNVKDHPHLAGQEGERWQFQATVDPETGMYGKVAPMQPVGDQMTLIPTEEGLLSFGRTGGDIKPVINPDTGEPVMPWATRIAQIKLERERITELMGKDLSGPAKTEIWEKGAGLDSIQLAMQTYTGLNYPNLFFQSQFLTNRAQKDARAAISAVLTPVRKAFSGVAVTPEEAKRSKDILLELEGPVTRDSLESSMITLSNMLWIIRRRVLLTEQGAGGNVSNFAQEMETRRFTSLEDIMMGLPAPVDPNEASTAGVESITSSDGLEIRVDAEGNWYKE